MKYAPDLWHIILVLLLLVTLVEAAEWLLPIWDKRLMPPRRVRPRRNRQRNRERWARRRAQWHRRRPRVSRGKRRQRRARVLWEILNTTPSSMASRQWKQPRGCTPLPGPTTRDTPSPRKEGTDEADPLADLRQSQGWIDHMDEQVLWAMLVQVRWPHGPACPCCGEDDRRYLKVLDADYRGGLGRWQCLVCAGAGDPGEGGTFTPLSGTILDGMRIDVRTLWLIVESFANGVASVETSGEARVNRQTTDRLFRLLRAAIYHTRSPTPIVLGPEDVAELDEVYITAGLKGNAGGLELGREPRKRGWHVGQ